MNYSVCVLIYVYLWLITLVQGAQTPTGWLTDELS